MVVSAYKSRSLSMSKEVRAGTQSRIGTDAEAIEKCYFLVCFL